MTREELILELNRRWRIGDDGKGYLDDIADFILSRERLILEKIGKPLRLSKESYVFCGEWTPEDIQSQEAIDEALAIIEKESV